ncbi:MAG TPA: ABC transporter permease, partial [Edaphobacter sp.]|nr:ABC transporter permease [Edaphobacter sp.]
MTDGYWRRMGGGAALDGRTIRLDNQAYVVTGVLAPGAALDEMEAFGQPSILTPIGCDQAKQAKSRGDSDFRGIARLKPGVSISAAMEDLGQIQRHLSAAHPRYYPPSFEPT